MICPNCGKNNSNDDFCMFCGYLINGNFINNNHTRVRSDLEIYLDDDYFVVTRNTNYIETFILGPLYLCYKKKFLIGFILGIIDILLVYFYIYEITNFIRIMGIFPPVLIIITIIIITRMFWVMVNNILYLRFIEKDIRKLKYRFKDKFINYIPEKRSSILLPIISIVLYIIIIILILFLHKIYF